MSQRRWYNPNVPQTLAIAQILLYLNGAFALLDALTSDGSALVRLLFLLATGAYVYGAYGIANEQKLGWKLGVVASFAPFVIRFFELRTAVPPGFSVPLGENLKFALGLTGGNTLNLIFDVALIALLLHPMSRNHQKIWFS
ncbi:MAG: hypothetical protein ACYC2O_01595 [Microthrixaceae bacterium]